MLAWLRTSWRRVTGLWRRSMQFRVILGTVLGATALVAVLVPALLGNISRGILGAAETSSLAEATAARTEAQRLLDAAMVGSDVPPSRSIDAVVAAMGARGAQAGLFEVLLLASEPAGLSQTPERGTNLVSETSVPAAMRTIVAQDQRQAWTYTTIRYTDGRTLPGFVVGAPLEVRGVGPYELYQLFPLDNEQSTLRLVRNSITAAGLLIVAGLSLLAWLVTHWLVRPVHEAASTARSFSVGHLESRMQVRGEDDLAQLAVSFNEMAGTMQEQFRHMEAMTRSQQQFVADVTHELRTPMTTVRMAADLLHDKRHELPSEEARAVELLQKQLNRFEALLGDLLETSRQDAGMLKLDYEDVDLRALAERVVASVSPLATEMRCHLSVDGPVGLVVPCDALRVERILANLLSNAVEHGQGTPVEVVVGRTADSALLSVTDHGQGMTTDELELAFTRFWRGDPARVRRVGGTGLGLSIALGDARAHGGALTASSHPGIGSTFTLRLPLSPGEEQEEDRTGPETAGPEKAFPEKAGAGEGEPSSAPAATKPGEARESNRAGVSS